MGPPSACTSQVRSPRLQPRTPRPQVLCAHPLAGLSAGPLSPPALPDPSLPSLSLPTQASTAAETNCVQPLHRSTQMCCIQLHLTLFIDHADVLTNCFRSLVALRPRGELAAAAYLACGRIAPDYEPGAELNVRRSAWYRDDGERHGSDLPVRRLPAPPALRSGRTAPLRLFLLRIRAGGRLDSGERYHGGNGSFKGAHQVGAIYVMSRTACGSASMACNERWRASPCVLAAARRPLCCPALFGARDAVHRACSELYKRLGDLGDVAQALKRGQALLARPAPLTLPGVLATLRQIAAEKGQGGWWTVEGRAHLSPGNLHLPFWICSQAVAASAPHQTAAFYTSRTCSASPVHMPAHAGSKGRRQRLVLSLLRACRESETKFIVRTLVQASGDSSCCCGLRGGKV